MSVTHKCNNAFDTEKKKKKEFINKFSLKCDPTACFLNSSMHFLGSFSLPPTQLHLLVAMTEREHLFFFLLIIVFIVDRVLKFQYQLKEIFVH